MKLQRSFMKGDFTITKEVTSGGYNMPYSHMHNSFEIYLLISGDRTVIIDDEKHKVAADDVTLFDKNIPHRSYGDAPYSGICIKFKDYYLNLYFTPLAKQELPVEGTEKAATIAEQLVSYVDNNYTSISNLSELTKLFNISESYIYKDHKDKLCPQP